MDIILIAWILLAFRIAGVGIILYIILAITYPNLKAENDPNVKPVRWALFILSILLLLPNAIPIIVDIATISGGVADRANTLGLVLSSYTLNAAIGDFIQSAGYLVLFLVSEKANVKLKSQNKVLQDDNDTLHKR